MSDAWERLYRDEEEALRFFLSEEFTLNTFDIYYEPADTDEPRRWLGMVDADTMGDALQKASEWWEVPSYDLVAVQVQKEQ